MNFLDQIYALPTLEKILLGVLIFSVLIQFFYFFYFYLRLAFVTEKKEKSANLPPVSIVVCTKNEEKNLRRLIPELMLQDYPEYEVVVVDDQSWDSSPEILSAFKLTYDNLHVIELRESNNIRMKGKKFALALGIKGAKYDQLLLTDADCSPASTQWIKSMMSASDKSITLGYSPYQNKKGLLNLIIRYDAFFIALQYLSFAKAGIPYMGVGRNLAYNKALFYDNGGFKKHSHVTSGDDDLFINAVANARNTKICIEDKAFVYTIPKTKWSDWLTQKRRHLSTAPHYKTIHKLLLALYPVVYVLFVASSVLLLILHTMPLLVISIIVLRFVVQLIIFIFSSKHLGEKRLAWISPILEFVLMTLNPVIYSLNFINKPKEWK